jgi:hypothetical protein
MKFVKNTKYYSGTVYEWNLPTGWTCPFAKECLVKVDKVSGKFTNKSESFRCYSANAERFPAVRNHRWNNFEHVKNGNKPIIPTEAKAIRIHASGDFFNQQYFDMWIDIAKDNPDVEFWAYTKSLNFWINRLAEIPNNLELTASYGGNYDELILQHNLKHTIVYNSIDDVPNGIPIDNNDDCARDKSIIVFALLNNFVYKKKNESILLRNPKK